MAETIGDRFKAVRKNFNMSQKAFADGIYLSNTFYQKMEKGHRKPNMRVFELMSIKYKVNKDWLITGNGNMFSETPPDVETEYLIATINQLDPLFKEYIINQIKQFASFHKRNKEIEKKTAIGTEKKIEKRGRHKKTPPKTP